MLYLLVGQKGSDLEEGKGPPKISRMLEYISFIENTISNLTLWDPESTGMDMTNFLV